MKKARRILAMLMAGCMLLIAVTACGGSAKPTTTSETKPSTTSEAASPAKKSDSLPVVRLAVPGISEQSTVDPISGMTTLGLKDFEVFLNEKITDAHIVVTSIPWDGWIQKMEAMATSGETDIAFFTNQVAVPDWYIDLTPYLEKDKDLNLDNLSNVFVEPAAFYAKYKSFNFPQETNKIFGLPINMACNVILYDKQLFEDWGMKEPTDDATLSELIEMTSKMTGKNPVTGMQNYGAYARTFWLEWYAISFDAVKKIESETMLLSDLDTAKYVDYIKDSKEVLDYFNGIKTIVENSPEGIATNTGNEKFLTADNDLALDFDPSNTNAYMKYVIAGKTEITDRFKPLLIPAGNSGKQGFPEFFKFSISKSAKNPDDAWNVLKQITTNKEIVDFYLTNYATDKISVLKDTEGMLVSKLEINQKRHDYQMNTAFITDDYWTWRIPLQNVNNLMISKEITPEEARIKFYEGVQEWITNTKAQLGQ